MLGWGSLVSGLELLELDHPGSHDLEHLSHSDAVAFSIDHVGDVVVRFGVVAGLTPVASFDGHGVHLALPDAILSEVELAILIGIGTVRELVGSGSLLGFPVLGATWFTPIHFMLLPPSAFFLCKLLPWHEVGVVLHGADDDFIVGFYILSPPAINY